MILTRHWPNSSIIIRWHSSAPAFNFLASMPRAKRHRHVACTTSVVKNLKGWLKKKFNMSLYRLNVYLNNKLKINNTSTILNIFKRDITLFYCKIMKLISKILLYLG